MTNLSTIGAKSSEDSPDMRALAVSYAEKGLYILPLVPNSKKPASEHAKDDATNDVKIIRKWWTRADGSPGKWNIGIRGKGLLILDFDIKEQPLVGVVAAFIGKFGRVPKGAPIVETPSGGRHAYLRLPEGMRVPNSVKKISPGVDVCGEDGYVVGPGSHTEATPDGKTAIGDYVLLESDFSSPPVAPEKLIEAAGAEKSSGDSPHKAVASRRNGRTSRG
jgi:hypothetical protein